MLLHNLSCFSQGIRDFTGIPATRLCKVWTAAASAARYLGYLADDIACMESTFHEIGCDLRYEHYLAFVLTGEYNHGYPAILKNALTPARAGDREHH